MRDSIIIALGSVIGSPLLATVFNRLLDQDFTVGGALTFGGFLGIFGLLFLITDRTSRLEGRVDHLEKTVDKLADTMTRAGRVMS